MRRFSLGLILLLGGCPGIIEYHVPSNDDEFYEMCITSGFIGDRGAHQYCMDRIAIYHENSKKKGRVPYANGDTTVFNYRYW